MTQAILIPPKNQANRVRTPQRGAPIVVPSVIERLGARYDELCNEYCSLIETSVRMPAADYERMFEAREQRVFDEMEEVLNTLADQLPATIAEVVILLQAAKVHADFTANGALEIESQEARSIRAERVEHILGACIEMLTSGFPGRAALAA